jgi:hypothetical protein
VGQVVAAGHPIVQRIDRDARTIELARLLGVHISQSDVDAVISDETDEIRK